MDTHLIVSTDHRGVARVQLNRPEVRNAFDEATIAQLSAAFRAFADDPELRVIVLSAAGRAFCAGADIAWMRRAAAQSEAANIDDARRLGDMLQMLASCPQPVLARVHGAAFGGGVGLACGADVVIASTDAVFAVSETRLGILPGVIGPYLVNAIGARQARRLALTGAPIDGAEALRLGLVHELVAAAELDAAVERCIDALLLGGPLAQRATKRLFEPLAAGPISAETRASAARTMALLRASPEAAEGFAAFAERRPPSWSRRPP